MSARTTAQTMVCFRTGRADYAVAVERVREVRAGDDIVPLPSPQPGVVGLLPWGDETVTVIDMLGAGRDHVLVLSNHQHTFGLLVEEVTGVRRIEGSIAPPPRGQQRECISGILATDDGLLMVVDVDALDERIGS